MLVVLRWWSNIKAMEAAEAVEAAAAAEAAERAAAAAAAITDLTEEQMEQEVELMMLAANMDGELLRARQCRCRAALSCFDPNRVQEKKEIHWYMKRACRVFT